MLVVVQERNDVNKKKQIVSYNHRRRQQYRFRMRRTKSATKQMNHSLKWSTRIGNWLAVCSSAMKMMTTLTRKASRQSTVRVSSVENVVLYSADPCAAGGAGLSLQESVNWLNINTKSVNILLCMYDGWGSHRGSRCVMWPPDIGVDCLQPTVKKKKTGKNK